MVLLLFRKYSYFGRLEDFLGTGITNNGFLGLGLGGPVDTPQSHASETTKARLLASRNQLAERRFPSAFILANLPPPVLSEVQNNYHLVSFFCIGMR